MKLYVFDDAVADGWAPFSLTRPCSELLFGSVLLRRRLERAAGVPAAGHLTRPWLADFQEEGAPSVVRAERIDPSADRVFLSSRLVPAGGLAVDSLDGPATLYAAGEVVGLLAPAGVPTPDAEWFGRPAPFPATREVEVGGDCLGPVWELVARNEDRLLKDLIDAAEGGDGGGQGGPVQPARALPEGVRRVGDGPVLLGDGTRIEAGVLLDTRQGPIRLDAGVEARAGARLAGPLHAGPASRLLGGSIERVSAGPLSYLRGEVEATVVLGHSNKTHDGFLGHAYLGRWVNLGAMTTNSDLKNNYSTVRFGPPGARVDTGLLKLGCLLGDHVKTGIGSLLGTGTVVGAGSNLFGGDMPPAWVAPFSWGGGDELATYRRDPFLHTAGIVMARRGVEVDDGIRAWLAAVWEAGAAREGAPSPAGTPEATR